MRWGTRLLATGAATLCWALALSGAAAAATFESGPVTYKSKTVNVPGNSPSFTGAPCGSGKRLAAPGIDAGKATINSVAYVDTDADNTIDDASVAIAYNDEGSPTKLTAWSVCLGGSKASKLDYVHSDGSIQSGGFGVGTGVSCSSGSFAGLGFRISGEASEAQLGALGFNFVGGKPDQLNGSTQFQKQGGLKLYSTQAACMDSGSGLSYRKGTGVIFPGTTKTIRASCPKNSRLIGGGFQGGFSDVVMASRPYDSGDKGKTPDDGWQLRALGIGYSGFVAEAICMRK